MNTVNQPSARPADSPADRRFLLGVLALSSLAGLSLLAFRFYYTGQRGYGFLPWNLLLAWLPLGFAAAAVAVPTRTRRGRIAAAVFGLLWLLFLPNAPYLVTDFKHLVAGGVLEKPVPEALRRWSPALPAPYWLDLLLVMYFAWNGLILGFLSLYVIHRAVRARLGAVCGWLVASAAILLCGFGVSLGRFQRWNSWDLFTRPSELLQDAAGRILNPLAHPRTLGATLGFAMFLLTAYLTLIALMRLHRSCTPSDDRN